MTNKQSTPASPLISEVTQFDVDFVIPRLGIDVPVGIDPFLLYKSRDPSLAALHDSVLHVFAQGIAAVRSNRTDEARRLMDFPEPAEIGLGYAQGSKQGSGVGEHLTELII